MYLAASDLGQHGLLRPISSDTQGQYGNWREHISLRLRMSLFLCFIATPSTPNPTPPHTKNSLLETGFLYTCMYVSLFHECNTMFLHTNYCDHLQTVLTLTVKFRKSQDFLILISGSPGNQIVSLISKHLTTIFLNSHLWSKTAIFKLNNSHTNSF